MRTLPQDYSQLCRWPEDPGAKAADKRVRKVSAKYTLQLPARFHGYIHLVVIELYIALMLTIYLKLYFANG